MKKQITCPECKGNGNIILTRKHNDYCGIGAETCTRCKGTGRLEVPTTNADRIRALSDEHLANYLMQFTDLDCRIGFCQNLPKCEALLDTEDGIPLSMCEKCLLNWLQQPAEEAK